MLGGAINDGVSQARQETIFDEGGERLTEAVVLAKRYPQARVVYTSGSSSFAGPTSTEALQARKFMSQMGIAPERVTIEDKSRNTDENARFTAAIVHPATFTALDCRHLRLSYAARDGHFRESGISSDRLSRGFSDAWDVAR